MDVKGESHEGKQQVKGACAAVKGNVELCGESKAEEARR